MDRPDLIQMQRGHVPRSYKKHMSLKGKLIIGVILLATIIIHFVKP